MLKMCVCLFLGMFGLWLVMLISRWLLVICMVMCIGLFGGEKCVVFFRMLNSVCLISVGCMYISIVLCGVLVFMCRLGNSLCNWFSVVLMIFVLLV